MTSVNLLLALGLVAGLLTVNRTSQRPDRARLLWILGCFMGLLGARLAAAGGIQTELLSGGLDSLGLGAGFALGAWACGRLLYPPKCVAGLLDDLAPGLAVALAVGRLGCWLEGCHSGSVTSVPWASTYGSSSAVFAGQLSRRQIDWLRPEALPVHPLPLYETGVALLAIIVWFYFRPWVAHRFPAGLLLPLSIAGYAALRVALETALGATGMIPYGWLALGIGALATSFLIWSGNAPVNPEPPSPSVLQDFR